MSGRTGRTVAEWVTFAVSAAIVLAVVVLLGTGLFGTEDPAAPVARPQGEVREVAGRWFVPVDVTNHGDQTAASVQVLAELTVGDSVVETEQVVDFLAGSETAQVVFSFDEDPQQGELEVRVGGYTEP